MKAEIITIGTEILLGEIVDTNSAYIARQLPELGIDLYFTSTVGDNLGRIVETLERAWQRSDLIITTGGLGPTADDLTREAVARLVGEEPYVDPELEARIRSFFASRGYPMPESNLKQAWLVPSARAIPNPRGTAPGWWVEKADHIIVCMPGVPAEMERMWREEVRPELERRVTGEVLVTRTLKTIGIGEGTVDEMARPVYDTPGVGIGTYARADGVHIRIGAKGRSREEAWAKILPVERRLEEIFGNAIWGKDDDTLEGVIGDLLHQRRESVATMESCTAGLVASTLADPPGASAYLHGGIIAYHAEEKIAAGVPAEVVAEHGVVSRETALAMARAARERFGATYGIGVTGVLGPDPLEGVPPGTVHVAVAAPEGVESALMLSMNQGRAMVKRRAVLSALLLLRRAILGELR